MNSISKYYTSYIQKKSKIFDSRLKEELEIASKLLSVAIDIFDRNIYLNKALTIMLCVWQSQVAFKVFSSTIILNCILLLTLLLAQNARYEKIVINCTFIPKIYIFNDIDMID